MHFTYLLINLIVLLIPVALSFDKRVKFYNSWPFTWRGLLITGLLFIFWDIIFTVKNVWAFNPQYVTGINILRLPVEEMLFFITVPFNCLFIYACLNHYVKREMSQQLTTIIANVVIVPCIVILIFYHHRLYTRISFTLLAFLLVLFQFIYKVKWLNRFFVAYLVTLIPFYVVNGLLTSLPVVIYNNADNMGLRIGTIPVEDHFYLMALLLMNTGFFEYYKRKKGQPRYA